MVQTSSRKLSIGSQRKFENTVQHFQLQQISWHLMTQVQTWLTATQHWNLKRTPCWWNGDTHLATLPSVTHADMNKDTHAWLCFQSYSGCLFFSTTSLIAATCPLTLRTYIQYTRHLEISSCYPSCKHSFTPNILGNKACISHAHTPARMVSANQVTAMRPTPVQVTWGQIPIISPPATGSTFTNGYSI